MTQARISQIVAQRATLKQAIRRFDQAAHELLGMINHTTGRSFRDAQFCAFVDSVAAAVRIADEIATAENEEEG